LASIEEKNRQSIARGRYFKWLRQRFQNIDLVELADEPAPINLRQIFVPMYVGNEDVNEGSMATPDKVEQEQPAGEKAWDLLIRDPFVVLSGRPGSGKSTLAKVLISELCSERFPDIKKSIAGEKTITPIPFILRDYPDIFKIENIDGLLDQWWEKVEAQSKQDKFEIDVPCLRLSLNAGPEISPLLLIFDGIDETGGSGVRSKIIRLAFQARQRGCRILITGRPAGLTDLDFALIGRELISSEQSTFTGPDYSGPSGPEKGAELNTNIKITYLLPFNWDQINTFIRAWYNLRLEWKAKTDMGVANFLNALQDKGRAYLQALARRPIFMTLMALVHCSRNEMPYGRAQLYEAIIDLYLARQERHRQ